MRIVVMCGGSGTRLYDYSLPKPLNYINGRHAITYVLEKANFKQIDFIVAPHLVKFQFESVIRGCFKDKDVKLNFHYLPYFTRGPVESAWLGTLNLKDKLEDKNLKPKANCLKTLTLKDEDSEPIVFLDNDVLFDFENCSFLSLTEGLLKEKETAFLGYSIDKSDSEAFCFLRMTTDEKGTHKVEEIKEKQRISDFFGCGVYGFASLKQFRQYAEPLLQNFPLNESKKELYMSLIYDQMIKAGEFIQGVYFKEPISHIGSLAEVKKTLPLLKNLPLSSTGNSPLPEGYLSPSSLRICFDLDQTLVTTPSKPNSFSVHFFRYKR